MKSQDLGFPIHDLKPMVTHLKELPADLSRLIELTPGNWNIHKVITDFSSQMELQPNCHETCTQRRKNRHVSTSMIIPLVDLKGSSPLYSFANQQEKDNYMPMYKYAYIYITHTEIQFIKHNINNNDQKFLDIYHIYIYICL